MAKVPFQQMTNGEKYSTYKKRGILATAGKWTSIIGPVAVLFGVKFNEYFSIVDGQEKIKLTIGSVLALIVAGFAVLQDFKRTESTKHLASVAGWGIALLLSWLLEVVLQDLTLILAFEFGGQCAAAGLNKYAEYCRKEADEYKRLAREDRTLGVKRPRSEETVRVRIR